jgi:hypothetical protein
MEIIKPVFFKLHSFVDVITNSSTTIFTYSSDAIKPAKNLINAFCKAMGYEKSADDMFFITCMPDNFYEQYAEHIEDMDIPFIYEESKADMQQLEKDIISGAVLFPEWLKMEGGSYEDEIESTISIYPKEEKYQEVADALKKFLYSPSQDARYNG